VAHGNAFLARWRVRLGYPLAPVYLWLALPTLKSLAWGSAIALLGLLLRAAAAGHLHKQEELTVSGPYAWTRNPLYFGSFLLVIGFAVASHSWVAAALIVGYYAIFYPAVMRREEDELQRKHGEAFDKYAARVPLFFPRAPRRSGEAPVGAAGGQLFSWDQYGRNREYQAALGFMVGVMLLVARMLVAGAG
jgi:protein-S-isoprenylcysteine O-methyltransferase Ste14